jgi:hypothetical protein
VVTYHLHGHFERDGFLFSYDVQVEQPGRGAVHLYGAVRPVVRLYDSGGIWPAAHGKAVMLLGDALQHVQGSRSAHLWLGSDRDGAFTATVFALATLTPEYRDALRRGVTEYLHEQPLNYYLATYIDPAPQKDT